MTMKPHHRRRGRTLTERRIGFLKTMTPEQKLESAERQLRKATIVWLERSAGDFDMVNDITNMAYATWLWVHETEVGDGDTEGS